MLLAKKSPHGCRASRVFGTAGGDLRYSVCFWISSLVVFQFLKFVVPGAFFAEHFGIALYFRAVGFAGVRIKDNAVILSLELKGFVLVIRVFDEKTQAAADGAFHFQIIQCLVFSC
jgi:hypothetical protein